MKYSHTVDNKKYTYSLNKEEQEILDDIEAGKYKSVANVKEELKKLREYAKYTLEKKKNINIRLSERDLQRLKAKAVEHGLPYQTLAATVLHNFASDKIKITL